MTTAALEIAPSNLVVQGTADSAPYPEQLVLDWTDYCNAKCFFCYREKYEQQIGGRGEFIPFEKLRKLERVLSKVKYFGISSGIGEPLLHPELEQILQWLYQINPGILIRTTTNGTALTASKAPWFAGHLDWLSVSLNASNGVAHMRDMFPHLAKSATDPERRWKLHLRHLQDFIEGLPEADRPRVRFQMVAHRHNIKDIVEFVRVVHGIGGKHVVITNIAVHADTVDWSLYWDRDLYNAAVDEACELGIRLGVRVDAARFFTSVKPVLDLDKVCRDPIDVAYISRASVGAPCCQWAEAGIPTDVYSDEEGFDRYWNHDVLARLRKKRDLESCRVCGMSRVFDETSFHLSPKLKQEMIESGKLSEINKTDDYPDAKLVRFCVDNRLDLPSVRNTLRVLGLAPETVGRIETEGLAYLPEIDAACWEAFAKAEVPAPESHDLGLAAPFLGIGWGPPVYEPQNRISARWVSAAQSASIFLRVTPGLDHHVRFTVHHSHPVDLVRRLKMTIGVEQLTLAFSVDRNRRTVISATIPAAVTLGHNGRLWMRLKCLDEAGAPLEGHFSLAYLLVKPKQSDDSLSEELWAISAEKDHQIQEYRASLVAIEDLLQQQQAQLAEKDRVIASLYNSRSWRYTKPLRDIMERIRK